MICVLFVVDGISEEGFLFFVPWSGMESALEEIRACGFLDFRDSF